MSRNKLKRYTGAEVAQPKSIAEQLLAGTRIGNLLYGKQETYKDGNNQERKDATFNESANGQMVQRMGETAKDAGNLALTGLAFGNPLTASNAMAPLIAGSQAYWIGHGINDGSQRIDNIGEGVKNFVEDSSWQNAGAVVNEIPMLALDVAGALPVARTVIETGKNVIPAAQQAAQQIAGSVDDAITNATKRVVESGVVGVNELPAQLAARATSTPTITSPTLDRTIGIQNRVFTGDPVFPKTTWQIPAFNTNSAYRFTGQSQIDDMMQTGFVRPKSGKIKGGHTNEVHWSAGNAKSGYNIQPGQYILESPRGLVDGTSSAIGINDLSHVWTTRNGKVVDIIDEVRPHMRTVSSPLSSKGAYTWFERPSKLTLAEKMGIPKGDRANLTISQLEEVTNQYLINKAFKLGQLKYGQPTAYTAYHQSATPITKFKFPFKERWDVRTHGADPNGAFFTAGEPAAAGFLAERPYTGQFHVKVQKPLIQTGELVGPTKNSLRNAIVRRARRDGADAVFFDGIADNQLQNQQILFATDNVDIGYRGMIGTPFKQGNWQLAKGVRNPSFNGKAQIMWMGPTTGKTTYAKINPNVVDIDPLTKGIRKQIADKLGLDFKDSRVSASTEYQEAIVDMVNNWLRTPSNRGKTLVASTKHLLDPKYKIKFANEPFIPDFNTFVARNQARGFRETPEQLRKWYDSILEIKPDIKIDNRFISEILNGQ